jgi:hypothetical protein
MKNRILAIVTMTVAIGVWTAQATPTLKLDDGLGNVVTIADGSGFDLNGNAGVVNWQGSLGVWTVNITTGVTKPAQGSALAPYMDISTYNSSSAAGSLTIWFSEVGFGPNVSAASFYASMGGTTTPGITDAAYLYADAGNALFGTGTQILQLGPFNTAGFSGSSTGMGLAGTSYSITEKVVLRSTGQAVTSFDYEASGSSVPDGGMTITLLGLACGALGFARRWMKA